MTIETVKRRHMKRNFWKLAPKTERAEILKSARYLKGLRYNTQIVCNLCPEMVTKTTPIYVYNNVYAHVECVQIYAVKPQEPPVVYNGVVEAAEKKFVDRLADVIESINRVERKLDSLVKAFT